MLILALVLVALPVIVAVYAYAIYPAALWLITRGRDGDRAEAAHEWPLITIVIPAYNESAQIAGAIEAMLGQDYPADRRQILVVSDASTDDTDAIVRRYADRGVDLFRVTARGGKTAAENAAAGAVRGEIVINSDASVRFEPSATKRLVAAMRDPRVGVASTRDVSVAGHGARPSSAESGYVGYEMKIRELETRSGGIVGASGSGYAIRAHLHRHPVRPDLSRDFSAALTAQRHGLIAVSVEDAVCYVPRTASLRREYRRKVRTISRGMDTLIFNRDLLDPSRHGSFAVKLISHKVCRWLVPVSAVGAAAGLALLAPQYVAARFALGGAALVLGLSVTGARWPEGRPVPPFLSTRVLGALASNLAVAHAFWRVLAGHQDSVWEPTRRHDAPSPQAG